MMILPMTRNDFALLPKQASMLEEYNGEYFVEDIEKNSS
jgi:hypothetical protein